MVNKEQLDRLYNKFNRREFVHPDPLEFLYDYKDIHDREIVGLIASSLAYGRVDQILKGVSFVLKHMPSPSGFLSSENLESLRTLFANFKYRFTTGEDLAFMLFGLKRIIEKYGSLYNCFIKGFKEEDESVLPGLFAFMRKFSFEARGRSSTLIPMANSCSACKRLNLFLRWMVREDNVDPGGWRGIPPSKLIVPLDTHLHKICLDLSITRRKQADLRTACDITAFFRKISPDDPVKYDFVLTRFGIWKIEPEIDM